MFISPHPFSRFKCAPLSLGLTVVALLGGCGPVVEEGAEEVEPAEHALVADQPAQLDQDIAKRYEEDWQKLKAIISFGKSGFSYVNGTIAAIAWLTGINNSAKGPSLDDIKNTIDDSLRQVGAEALLADVGGLAADMRELRSFVTARAHTLMMGGHSPEAVLSDPSATNYLSDLLRSINSTANRALSAISIILHTPTNTRPEGYSVERQVVAVLPAYLMLIPLKASATKMVGDLFPTLAGAKDENLNAIFQTAGETLYRAVGVYSISFLEGNADLGPTAVRLFSPVGQDQSLMFRRPLYAYYHRFAEGRLNSYPALRFSQYQSYPLANTALTLLQQIDIQLGPDPANASQASPAGVRRVGRLVGHPMRVKVTEERVWIPDPGTDPNHMRTQPAFQDVTEGRIDRIWACDQANPYCPQLSDQPN